MLGADIQELFISTQENHSKLKIGAIFVVLVFIVINNYNSILPINKR